MRPVAQTPTEATDYAALTTVYGALLGTVAASTHGREPVPGGEVPLFAAATFALSRLIVHEKIESWIRRPFVDEREDGRRPKGRRLRYAVGELLTCTRCTGAWSALALVGLRLHAPAAGRAVATVLAVSAGNDIMQAGFSWLSAGADTRQHDAEVPERLRRSAA